MKFIKQIIIPLLTVIVILGIGIFFYHSVEKWSYLDSAYFTVVTMTTIGYGDFTPVTDLGKIFTIFFIFIGILAMFYLLSSVGRYFFMRLIRERLIEEGRIKNKRGVIRVKR